MRVESVFRKVHDVSNKLSGDIKPGSVIRYLNAAFKNTNVRFYSDKYSQDYFKTDFILISGEYIRSPVSPIHSINIILSFPSKLHGLKFNKQVKHNLERRIVTTLYHELQHKKQVSKKKQYTNKRYKSASANMSYMGSADEIDAHAFEVVADKRYGKFHINKLSRANKISRTESEAIWMYRKVFRHKDFKTWKTFLKKVYKYATKSNQKLFPI